MAKFNSYGKPPLTTDEHISLLRRRGLVIENESDARYYLKYVGYYRLSGYFSNFKDEESSDYKFIANTNFDDVVETYIFDRKLRLLVMDAVERIEVGTKSLIIDHMCLRYGSHWYEDSLRFSSKFEFENFTKKIHENIHRTNKVRDINLETYYPKGKSPKMPPFWMVCENSSFGTVSLIYQHLPSEEKKLIAKEINVPYFPLTSWLHSISILRNLCAHHARVWNRKFTFTPKYVREYKKDFNPNTVFYTQAVILHLMLKGIVPKNTWAKRLQNLFAKYPSIEKSKKGFDADWQQRDLWQLS